jgi:hypothetical protein
MSTDADMWSFDNDDDLQEWCTRDHSYFILNEESLCKISKVYDGKSAGNLILILNLEMKNFEQTFGFNLNIFKILKWHYDNGNENKICKDDTNFLNNEVITVKCSACQTSQINIFCLK